jgi:hypothetical protein
LVLKEKDMNDDEIVEGEVSELEVSQGSTMARNRKRRRKPKQVAGSDSAGHGQPAGTNGGDGRASAFGPHTAADTDLHPLLKARAEEFARRHKAMTDAYERALFGTMTDALESMHRPPVAKSPKAPLVARLASSVGETLMQAGQRLVTLAEPDDPAPVSVEPLPAIDRPAVIVFAEDGGIDD